MKVANLPYVSIIVINYNGKHHLEKCLPSLRKLKYPSSRCQIIIVDNDSTDESVRFVEENFPDMHVTRLHKNYGWVGAANLIVKQAIGDNLAFLNNDITVDENWLIELVRVAESNGDIEICTSKKLVMDDPSALDGAGGAMNIIGQGWDREMLRRDVGQCEEIAEVTHPSGASFFMRRRAINCFGYVFDPDYFMYIDDLDLGWRTRLLGLKVVYVPKSVVFHKGGGSASCSPFTYYYFYRNMLVSFCKNLERSNLVKLFPLLLSNVVFTHLFAFISYKDTGYIVNISKIFVYMITTREKIAEKRKQVQRLRKATDQQIFSLFSATIISPKTVVRAAIVYKSLVNLYLKILKIRGSREIKEVFTY